MSRHRRQHRREEISETSNKGLNLNNIDLNNIAALVNSIDLNQLSSLVGSLSQSAVVNGEKNNTESNKEVTSDSIQRRSELVKAVRTLINADKSELLQIMLQLYGANRTDKK